MIGELQQRETNLDRQSSLHSITWPNGGSFRKGSRSLTAGTLLLVFACATLCFFVINITNDTILPILGKHHLLYTSADTDVGSADKTIRFIVDPIKEFIFFFASAVLLIPVAMNIHSILRQYIQRRDFFRTCIAIFTGILLTATIFPISFSRFYARKSTDPFNQIPDQLYRRFLMPALAHLYHCSGILYAVFAWAVLLVLCLLLKAYLRTKYISVSLLQEISLLTVGIFACSFQSPGTPETLVLALALTALIDFDREQRMTYVGLSIFALSMMAHESATILILGPVILFCFGWRWLLAATGLVVIYVFALLSNFSFHLAVPLAIQSNIGDLPAKAFLLHNPLWVVIGAFFGFKALWLLLPVGIWYGWKENRTEAVYCAVGVLALVCATYIAVDYSRIVGFATIPIILCFVFARRHLAPGLLTAIMVINLMLPSFFYGGNTGMVSFKGLYYEVYRYVPHVRPPLVSETNRMNH